MFGIHYKFHIHLIWGFLASLCVSCLLVLLVSPGFLFHLGLCCCVFLACFCSFHRVVCCSMSRWLVLCICSLVVWVLLLCFLCCYIWCILLSIHVVLLFVVVLLFCCMMLCILLLSFSVGSLLLFSLLWQFRYYHCILCFCIVSGRLLLFRL